MIWPGLGGPSPTSPPWAGLLLLPTGLQPQLHQAWSLVFEVYFYLVFGLILLSRRRSVLLGLWGAWLLACAATGVQRHT